MHVSAPSLSAVSLLIFQNNLSSQGNVTLPCQLCLHLPPPPTVSLCISLSLHLPLRSHLEHAGSPLFSYLITFYALLALLASDATEQNPLRHVSPDPSRFHGHKPQEKLTDEEETNNKLLSCSFFAFHLLLLLLGNLTDPVP